MTERRSLPLLASHSISSVIPDHWQSHWREAAATPGLCDAGAYKASVQCRLAREALRLQHAAYCSGMNFLNSKHSLMNESKLNHSDVYIPLYT